MSLDVAAIVLAAGESSRMGRSKPLLPLDGETFLTHLLSQIKASRVTRTTVVLGYRPEVVLDALPQIQPFAVVNPNYELGQLSSLHVGLETVGEVGAVVMFLADHPFISTQIIDSLVEAYEQTGRPIVLPTHGGRRGHPTLFGRAVVEELKEAPLDQGARVIVRAHASEILEIANVY